MDETIVTHFRKIQIFNSSFKSKTIDPHSEKENKVYGGSYFPKNNESRFLFLGKYCSSLNYL